MMLRAATAERPSRVRAALGWSLRHAAFLLAGLLLAGLYTQHYLADPARPGHNPLYPLGWWGWWDQSNYLASAAALAHLDPTPARHLYPLGYALLGAPFIRAMPSHPFFLVDLVALLAALLAFVSFARRCGLAPAWGAAVFVLAAAGDPVLFEQWVVPWNTSPLAAALWLLLAIAAAHLDGERRPILLGLAAVSIPMLRPADLLLTLPPLAACLWADISRGGRWGRDAIRCGLAGLAGGALYLGLHGLIYGLQPSPYMRLSAGIGFTLHHVGWKAYIILVDPRAWIGGGTGLLWRCPWLLPGLAGLIPAMRRPKTAMLAITLLLHSLLYICYVDLLPSGFWRYLNVHYWTWAFPGFALLGVLLVRTLLGRDGMGQAGPGRAARPIAIASLAAVAILLCVRFDPAPAAPGQSIDALDFLTPPAGFDSIYFGQLGVTDAGGSLANVTQLRGIPMSGGVRILALTRSFREPITVHGGGLDGLTPIRLHARPGIGIPFWPWKRSDAFYGPR